MQNHIRQPVVATFSFVMVCGILTPTFAADVRSAASGRTTTVVQAPAKEAERPEWKEIEKAVKDTLAEDKDYKPGDLLTQKHASRVFASLNQLGWPVENQADLNRQFLSPSDELARQSRSPQGKKFMRNIAQTPGGFDRLDRLRKLPRGSQQVRELIQEPEGHKLIEFMATTPQGKQMGRELSSRRRGDFNAPTKKIYTERDFLAALKESYQSESAEAETR